MIQKDALNDEDYHTENHQIPQYGDILDVTYVTITEWYGRDIF